MDAFTAAVQQANHEAEAAERATLLAAARWHRGEGTYEEYEQARTAEKNARLARTRAGHALRKHARAEMVSA